jgi:hypothetical protein
VDKVDNVRTNGGLEDGRKRNGASDVLTTIGVDVDDRSGSGLHEKRLITVEISREERKRCVQSCYS